ncbi:MAG: thiamine pyrophosphate-dependent dehydrogenase E1 component subunit alpha [Thermoleophilia bacterium]
MSEGTLTGERLELAVRIYDTMLRIRRFEERVGELFAAGELPGFVHLSIGQESVAAGIVSALRDDDFITATHRGHGHILAKGARIAPMMAELFGRTTGYCKGKGGSMHIVDIAIGVLGANGILGAGQPIAVGAAMSARLRGTDQVVATFFGEGASAQGAVHEAMNLAGCWQAPILFVAEINGYAELTPYEIHASVPSIAVRGAAYGIPATTVDGVDVLAVHDAATEAVAAIRAGGGPRMIEIRTQRWHGHYEGDPQRYRPDEELARLPELDPLAHLEPRLLAAGVERARLDALDADVRRELDEALEFARQSPLPDASALLEDVYAR